MITVLSCLAMELYLDQGMRLRWIVQRGAKKAATRKTRSAGLELNVLSARYRFGRTMYWIEALPSTPQLPQPT